MQCHCELAFSFGALKSRQMQAAISTLLGHNQHAPEVFEPMNTTHTTWPMIQIFTTIITRG